ncbi:MAG TPA: hypothetical protein ENH46_03305 [Candidatus Pacearchaeota archaeon]|nr:hypothetical protein [Candidatus Pacearchaeota archaeon]
MKCPHCKKEVDNEEWIKIPELGIEVQKDVNNKNKSWDELGLSEKEDQLLTSEQCIWLANSKYAKALKMDGSSSNDDFFIKQPFNLNRKNGYVAGFNADSGCAYLYCVRVASFTVSYLGVRFVRKKISKSKRK